MDLERTLSSLMNEETSWIEEERWLKELMEVLCLEELAMVCHELMLLLFLEEEMAMVCLVELILLLCFEEKMALVCLELVLLLLLEKLLPMVWLESWVKLVTWLLMETKGLPISCLPR